MAVLSQSIAFGVVYVIVNYFIQKQWQMNGVHLIVTGHDGNHINIIIECCFISGKYCCTDTLICFVQQGRYSFIIVFNNGVAREISRTVVYRIHFVYVSGYRIKGMFDEGLFVVCWYNNGNGSIPIHIHKENSIKYKHIAVL